MIPIHEDWIQLLYHFGDGGVFLYVSHSNTKEKFNRDNVFEINIK